MTPEDAAKLLDMKGAEKTDNSDGSYTLSRTEKVTDEKTGKTITRTTYVTVTGSNVTTRTTTTLTVTREKEEHTSEKDGFGKDGVPVSGEFTLPEITVTDQNDPENKRTISPDTLGRLIAESRSQGSDTAAPDGSTIYTVAETDPDGTRRTYTITEKKQPTDGLSGAEIAQTLNEKLGSTLDGSFVSDGKDADGRDLIYYIDSSGRRSQLTVKQTEDIRVLLSYSVDLTETSKDTGTAKTEDGKDPQAEVRNARTDAVRDALKNAAADLKKDGELSQAEYDELVKTIDAETRFDLDKGGVFTAHAGGKDFRLNYTAAKAGITSGTPADTEDKADRTERAQPSASAGQRCPRHHDPARLTHRTGRSRSAPDRCKLAGRHRPCRERLCPDRCRCLCEPDRQTRAALIF